LLLAEMASFDGAGVSGAGAAAESTDANAAELPVGDGLGTLGRPAAALRF
jgi:hypothetical protein